MALAQDRRTLIGLLDPERLAQQTQVWANASPGHAPSAQQAQAPSPSVAANQTETFAVLRLGATFLALPAAAVGEIRGADVLKRMAGVSPEFLGMTQWRMRDVPVLDMVRLLGLPVAVATPDPVWQVVLHWQGQVLAFYVHEIRAVRSFDAASLQGSAGEVAAMQLFCQRSCLGADGGRVYLLDAQALLDASPLSRGAAAPEPAGLRLGQQSQGGLGALVVFKSRQLWAASMGLMREILALPAGLPAGTEPGAAQRGRIEWHGQSVALLDLRKLLDARDSVLGPDARIIVTQVGARTLGLLVEGVTALVPGHAASRYRFSSSGRPVEMVTVGRGTEQASYQVLDLAGLPCFAPAPEQLRAQGEVPS